MNYPVWQLGFPGGLLIAAVAVLHVFVSHFAVGGGAYLVLTERRGYKRNNPDLLAYVKRHSKFFALLTVVFGAVSGVGIWFTIGLVSPEATSSLIHTFVWAWAIEWVFFFVEIASILIYAYQWDKLDRRAHLAIGWVYFISAWLSLFVINGIITYMLTPGAWLQTKNFWDGFFNPTFRPSLLIRTSMALALAGMFGLVTALRTASPLREHIVRWAGGWLAIGVALLPLFGFWYYAKLPGFSDAYFAGMIPAAHRVVMSGVICAAVALGLALVFALLAPRAMNIAVVAVLLVCGLAVMGSGEWVREFARKPWVVNGYIYANGIRVSDASRIDAEGAAQVSPWLAPAHGNTLRYGRALFASECSSCHSVNGYRAMSTRVRGWNPTLATDLLAHLPLMRGTMPPFAGNAGDREALGMYLASIAPSSTGGGDQIAVGRQVFVTHCGLCHTLRGDFRPLDFTGMDADSINDIVQNLDNLSPNMPPFVGTDAERRALIEYFHSGAK
jgi:mono/diheme cytochrome c family protein